MFMLDCLVGVRKYIGSSVSRKSLPAKADKRAAVFNYDDATAKTFLAWPRGAGPSQCGCSQPFPQKVRTWTCIWVLTSREPGKEGQGAGWVARGEAGP